VQKTLLPVLLEVSINKRRPVLMSGDLCSISIQIFEKVIEIDRSGACLSIMLDRFANNDTCCINTLQPVV